MRRVGATRERRIGVGLLSGCLSRCAVGGLFACATLCLRAQEPRRAAPIERRAPVANSPASVPHQPLSQSEGGSRLSGQHLAQWMESHRELPLDQQQRALESEPGFRQLQPQVQERMHQRLQQLNTMSPDQRQRVISRTEQMERLSLPERQQVRGALSQLGSLPQDRRRAVARSFRALQAMPEQERQSYLNSPQLRSQFNDQERGTLNSLLQVAPMLPTQSAPAAPPH